MGVLVKEVEIKVDASDISFFDPIDIGKYFSNVADDATFIETINCIDSSCFKELLSASEDYANTDLTDIGRNNIMLIREWANKILSK